MMLGILLSFAILGLLYKGAANTSPSTGGVERGQLYRVQIRVPISYVKAIRDQHGEAGQKMLLRDLERRVEEHGFEKTLLSMQDPTDNTLFTLLTRGGGRKSESTSPPSLQFITIDAVDEPSLIDKLYIQNRQALDSGLSPEEIIAIRQALLEDMNPRHLNGFAHTLEPFFPVAASLLRAKANILDLRKLPSAKTDVNLDKILRSKLREIWALSHHASSDVSSEVKEKLLRGKAAIEQFARQKNLPISIAHDELRRVACLLNEQDEDKNILKFPPSFVWTANVLLRDIFTTAEGEKVNIVSPERLNLLIPPNEAQDGFISPSALQLAMATSKPLSSGVFKAGMAPKRYDSLLNVQGNNVQGIKARAQMERANRALERRRWVDWYRRKTIAKRRGAQS